VEVPLHLIYALVAMLLAETCLIYAGVSTSVAIAASTAAGVVALLSVERRPPDDSGT
jgi:hypothetical protein